MDSYDLLQAYINKEDHGGINRVVEEKLTPRDSLYLFSEVEN